MKPASISAFVLLLLASAAQAQPVCQSELFVMNLRARGRVLQVGPTLVFIEDQSGSAQVRIEQSNIRNWSRQSNLLSIDTRNPVTFRGLAARHFTFQFTSPNCEITPRQSHSQPHPWVSPNPSRSYTRRPAQPRTRRYEAKYDRMWPRGDIEGNLTVSDKTIIFKPRGGGDSLMWELRDIRDIEHEGSSVLLISPCAGGRYKFHLLDGISRAEVKALRDRVRRARPVC